jgi:hypothetical protein
MSKAATALEFEEVKGSSNVHSRAYDAAKQLIIVRFHNGSQYAYKNSNAQDWKEFQRAKSAGKHIATQMRKHTYDKLDDWT